MNDGTFHVPIAKGRFALMQRAMSLAAFAFVFSLGISAFPCFGKDSSNIDKSEKTSFWRTWHSADGKYSAKAEFVEFSDGTVYLRKSSKKIVSPSLERLSKLDQEYIQALAANGNILVGRVTEVLDGDSVIVTGGRGRRSIDLKGIDFSEKDKDFIARAKAVLSRKVLKKRVKVKWQKEENEKRIAGEIYIADRWINKEMLEEGAARLDARGGEEASKAPTADPTVYVTRTGKKYHCEDCSFLKKSKMAKPLSQARKTYTPCSRCKPPR